MKIIGLNAWATKLVSATEKATDIGQRIFEDGRVENFRRNVEVPTVTQRENGSFSGMLGETYPLLEYTLRDGRIFQEYVQSDEWSSGPVIFLALKQMKINVGTFWDVVPESLWTDEEIADA
jgi:hypothetical protein